MSANCFGLRNKALPQLDELKQNKRIIIIWQQAAELILHIQVTSQHLQINAYPAGIYYVKVKEGNTRTMCDICSKLKTQTCSTSFWCL